MLLRYKGSMAQPEHILIVDDDAEIRNLLKEYFERNGMRATVVADGRDMCTTLARSDVDLVVLDLMLRGEDGLALCRDLRARSNIPVIMLTARGEETDRIVGLEMGADDYLPKPFNPRELLARIKSVLRRRHGLTRPVENTSKLYFAGWVLDSGAHQLTRRDGVAIALSSGEYRLLCAFLEHPNRILSRDQLLDLTRGREALPFDRSIDMQVGRLRKRLGDTADETILIKTVRSEGYMFVALVKTEI